MTESAHLGPWGFAGWGAGHRTEVFFLFSSRLGCLGSLLISALVTLLLLLLLDVL